MEDSWEEYKSLNLAGKTQVDQWIKEVERLKTELKLDNFVPSIHSIQSASYSKKTGSSSGESINDKTTHVDCMPKDTKSTYEKDIRPKKRSRERENIRRTSENYRDNPRDYYKRDDERRYRRDEDKKNSNTRDDYRRNDHCKPDYSNNGHKRDNYIRSDNGLDDLRSKYNRRDDYRSNENRRDYERCDKNRESYNISDVKQKKPEVCDVYPKTQNESNDDPWAALVVDN